MNRWVLRVQLPTGHAATSRDLVDLLGRAGVVVVHRDDAAGICFDVLPPAPASTPDLIWATENARRMQSFGINAAPAPRAPDGGSDGSALGSSK